tara:strand:- start:782 stop:1501 length:720 start_codon:yes stop_codon:yes gene_type:complete
MTYPNLSRLVTAISDSELISCLRSGSKIPVEELNQKVDLSEFDEKVDEIIKDKITDSAIDGLLVETLHRALKDLPEGLLVDMRLWQWFTVVRHPDLVWLRWRGSVPIDPENGFKNGNGSRKVATIRFLGSSSINGHGRNTFARLFFAAERLLGRDNDNYDLVRRLFTSQELHLGISDREFGLIPAVNRVLAKELADLPDLKVRSSIKKLNSLGGSFCLDLLNDSELTDLLQVETNEQAA